MSYNQPPPSGPPSWGQVPPPPMPPQPLNGRPKWARKRIAIPIAALIFFVGVGIGSSGDDQATAASGKPAPRVTVTEAAKGKGKAAPAPTVTVTKSAKAAAVKAKPKPKKTEAAAPANKVVFKVWGSAPSGADITYGSDSDSLQGSGLPMTKTLTVNDDALYYHVTAQLSGGGDIHCSVTVEGKTKSGHAAGGYNICSAQLSSGFLGGWS